MFDSKSPLVKIVSYAVTGFFVLIIVVSFGMPDFMSRWGFDPGVVAIVNGEKVSRIDYLRFRDTRFGHMRGDKKQDATALDEFVKITLLLQEIRKSGIYVTDEAVKDYIRNIPDIRDPETGKLTSERLTLFLEQNNISFNDLQKTLRRDMLIRRYMQFIQMGAVVPPREVSAEYAAKNSRIQIRYSFLGSMDLQNMAGQAAVTDAEVTAEMEKNKKEIKDPKTDRERIRKKLESEKLGKIKKDIIDKINAIALAGGSFDQAQALLKGKTGMSKIFKAGDRITDEQGQPLTSISNSKIFQEDFMEIGENRSSRVIAAESGLYIFTPVLKDIKKEAVPEKDYDAIAANLGQESMWMIQGNLIQKMYEKVQK